MPSLDTILLIAGAACGLAAIACAVFGWRSESSLIAIADAPTRSAVEVNERHSGARVGRARFGEPVEVVGIVECDQALEAPYTGTRCVAYDCHMTEEHERRVGGGRYRRGREIETHGIDLHDNRVARFYVRDATGAVAVEMAGASLDMPETLARYEKYTGLGGSEREIWREERALPVGKQVYVLGYLCDDNGTPLIARDPTGRKRRFLIGYGDERRLAHGIRMRAYSLYLAGGLGAGAAVVLLFFGLR